ncbi:hypothetical protein MXB_2825, partial [Myxobolus squamalis]
ANTIEKYFKNNSIEIILKPATIDGETSTFDVYQEVANNKLVAQNFSKVTEKMHENNNLKKIILARNNIMVESIWFTNDNINYPHIMYDTKYKENMIILIIIIIILMIVSLMNLIKYYAYDEQKSFA